MSQPQSVIDVDAAHFFSTISSNLWGGLILSPNDQKNSK